MPELSGELFGERDMRPWAKKEVGKVITRERLEEVRKMLEGNRNSDAAAVLRDMHERLEVLNRRISNK